MGDLQFLTLDDIKAQCRVDFEDDDALLAQYGRAAEDAVVRETRRSVEELTELGGGAVPQPLKLAALMLTAHFYRLREPVSGVTQDAVPYALDYLVKPFVKLTEK